MDAILISWDPCPDEVEEVTKHLADGHEYYWRVRFRFASKSDISFPALGYVHMKGGRVEYKMTIRDIIPFSPDHYESTEPVVPESWIREWNENPDQRKEWKNELVITKIEGFHYDTYRFRKYSGGLVIRPPQSFVRVLPPDEFPQE